MGMFSQLAQGVDWSTGAAFEGDAASLTPPPSRATGSL